MHRTEENVWARSAALGEQLARSAAFGEQLARSAAFGEQLARSAAFGEQARRLLGRADPDERPEMTTRHHLDLSCG